jgi:hypothetical protein
MNGEFKLPEVAGEAFGLPPGFDRIWKILWAVDPAHLRHLGDKIITEVVKANIAYRQAIASAELELINAENSARLKIKQAELDALNAIQEKIR